MKTRCKLVIIIIFFLFHNSLFSQHWQSLQKGLDGLALCFFEDTNDNILYIGGNFRIAGDSTIATAIATWDGINFSPVGCGFDYNCTQTVFSPGFYPGPVNHIIKYNGDIYACGSFKKADNKPIKYLAKWNGVTWDSVRTGVIGVGDFLIHNNELYMCGMFDNYNVFITKWDGASWTNIPTFPTYAQPEISTLAFYKNELYFGGNFYSSAYPNDTIQNIIRYNGTNWKSVGGGFHGGWGGLNCMAIYKNELYVGGLFTTADGNPGNYIAKWDGNSWSDVGGGLGGTNGQVYDLKVYHNELYAVGVFISAGGVPARYIAKWDGTNWCGLGSTFNPPNNYALGVYQDMLYIGGQFFTIDGDSLNCIAKWTGGSYVSGCGNTSGINEINNTNNFITVFPNPSNGNIVIGLKTVNSNNFEIGVYDVLGRSVYNKMINYDKNKFNLDLTSLANGLYLLRIKSNNNNFIQKFMIQK